MSDSVYLFHPGRISRKNNTLCYTREKDGTEENRFVPIENLADVYVFGSLDANSALFNFLGKRKIALHFFDYYDNYTGSFLPRDYLLAGKVHLEQAQAVITADRRLLIAQRLVDGAAQNILRNLKYYQARKRQLKATIGSIEKLASGLHDCAAVDALMGVEGSIRRAYYAAIDKIVPAFKMNGRSKRPPGNEINAMISFANSLCYAACLSQLYHTQLDPTLSFLHEPGARRFSLALDLAEIFKPILADRLVFRMLNRKEIQVRDFERDIGSCVLRPAARKKFVQAFDERLRQTIQHRTLGREVSYRYLIRLECYKIEKHILGIEEYKPYISWW